MTEDEYPALRLPHKSRPPGSRTITPTEQLHEWVKGNSVHNGKPDSGECCPDFSCCQPELLAPEAVRIAFRDANDEARLEMLGLFLSAGIGKALEGKDNPPTVYVAGDAEREQ